MCYALKIRFQVEEIGATPWTEHTVGNINSKKMEIKVVDLAVRAWVAHGCRSSLTTIYDLKGTPNFNNWILLKPSSSIHLQTFVYVDSSSCIDTHPPSSNSNTFFLNKTLQTNPSTQKQSYTKSKIQHIKEILT